MRKHAVSCGSGWSVPCVSIQLTLSQTGGSTDPFANRRKGSRVRRNPKIDWTHRCNGGTVTNLQHDGVIMKLAPYKTPRIACAELTLACTCTTALGFPQPVEEKPFDDQTVDDSDSEDDHDGHDHDKTTMMMTTRMTACNVCNHSITHTASLSRMALGKTSRRALQ